VAAVAAGARLYPPRRAQPSGFRLARRSERAFLTVLPFADRYFRGVSASTTKTDARRTFDRWAGSYERDPFSRWIGRRQSDALEALELGEGDRLLDVGCGTGAAVRAAAEVVERAVGVDLSPKMLAEARERAAGLPDVDFVEGDSEDLPFGDREFTAVLCTTSLHHYPRPEAAIREIARVLAPGGRVVIGDATNDAVITKVVDFLSRKFEAGHVRYQRLGELRRLLEDAGLECTGARSMWGGIYGVALGRKADQRG
jgi:ubiquinone/menaquinone biosynthesis C-methylase UbiE